MTIFWGRFDQFRDVLTRGILTLGRFDCNPEKHDIFNDCQHGFKAKRSCETQILPLYHELARSLDKKTQTDMVIIDFSKTFDRVPQQRLLKKMHHYGIRDNAYQWIASFLSQRTQQVLVEGQSSEKVPVISGAAQGSVLRRVLFLIFINYIPVNLNWKAWMFADDFIVDREIKSNQDQLILKEDLNTLAEWERKWGMDLHTQKCNVLRVSWAKSTLTFS